jgi:hypothetical protein
MLAVPSRAGEGCRISRVTVSDLGQHCAHLGIDLEDRDA